MTKAKLKATILHFVIWLSGTVLLIWETNWKVWLAILLIMWAYEFKKRIDK